MKKLFLLVLLSFGLSAISYAGPYDDWPDDAVCMWLEQKPTHAGYLGEAKKRGISCEGGVAVKTKTTSKLASPAKATADPIISSPLFDGRYSFTISRYNENEGSKRLGNGYIEINNGIVTVAKEGRTLDTGSIDLYDSFAGQINKKGNIMSSLKISVLTGVESPPLFLVDLNGSIDSPLQGEWDHYFDVILKLGKKDVETNELFATIEASDDFDGTYAFSLLGLPPGGSLSPIGEGTLEINEGIITINKDSKGPKYDSFEGRIDKNGDIVASFYFRPCPLGLSLMNCEMEDKSIVFKGFHNSLTNKLHLSGVHGDTSVYFYLTKE